MAELGPSPLVGVIDEISARVSTAFANFKRAYLDASASPLSENDVTMLDFRRAFAVGLASKG